MRTSCRVRSIGSVTSSSPARTDAADWGDDHRGADDDAADADAYRIEHDTMGEVRVPRDALYQAQTQRAVENFPISGTPIEPAVLRALGRIKGAAARVNDQLGVVPSRSPTRSSPPAAEVTAGRHDASSRSTSTRPARAPRAT
jgi:hypothetical protein